MKDKIQFYMEDVCHQLSQLLFSNFYIIYRDKRFPNWENRYFNQNSNFLELHRIDLFTEDLI